MSNMTDLRLSGVFFQAVSTLKFVFGRGSAPDPAGGASPHSRLGRGTPLPIPFPPRRLRRLDLGAFSASVVMPPPNTNSWLRL